MKKTNLVVATLLSPLLLNANNFSQNIESLFQDKFKVNAKVIKSVKLESVEGLNFTILNIKENNQNVPVYTTTDGKYFIGFSPIYSFNKKDSSVIQAELTKLEEVANAQKNKGLISYVSTLPDDLFVTINATIKTDKTIVVITDPECPFCRKELANIDERLKTANIKLLFAPVHQESAFIKSKLILEETKKFKPTQQNEIMSVLKKYYGNVDVSSKTGVETATIHNIANTLFGQRMIGGVPHAFELKANK